MFYFATKTFILWKKSLTVTLIQDLLISLQKNLNLDDHLQDSWTKILKDSAT